MYTKLDMDLKYIDLEGFRERLNGVACRARAVQVGISPKHSSEIYGFQF